MGIGHSGGAHETNFNKIDIHCSCRGQGIGWKDGRDDLGALQLIMGHHASSNPSTWSVIPFMSAMRTVVVRMPSVVLIMLDSTCSRNSRG